MKSRVCHKEDAKFSCVLWVTVTFLSELSSWSLDATFHVVFSVRTRSANVTDVLTWGVTLNSNLWNCWILDPDMITFPLISTYYRFDLSCITTRFLHSCVMGPLYVFHVPDPYPLPTASLTKETQFLILLYTKYFNFIQNSPL